MHGWSNYPTWAVISWLKEDLAADQYWKKQAAALGEYQLAQDIKDSIEQAAAGTIPESGMITDLFRFSLDSVDFEEIARAYKEEELKEYMEEES